MWLYQIMFTLYATRRVTINHIAQENAFFILCDAVNVYIVNSYIHDFFPMNIEARTTHIPMHSYVKNIKEYRNK